MKRQRTYVGFGFGAIQTGLFLHEAFRARAFERLVVAEILPDLIDAVRQAGGQFVINIAHANRVERVNLGPVELEDTAIEADRQRLIAAIAEAEEMGTAIPSVKDYASDKPGSVHRLLAAGLRRKVAQDGPRAVIYTAENHNHAAEILEENVMAEIPANEHAAVRARVRFLNTVIGKMCRNITDLVEIGASQLATATPAIQRAYLSEAFNRILISKVQFDGPPPFVRGIQIFAEKDDLLPFEEAKLYGHNATQALAAYIGAAAGLSRIADILDMPGVRPFLRAAILTESGGALIRKYQGLDPLFTPEGYQEFADDMLDRMANRYLQDTVERVGRDPARKLDWDDRLVGTMRLALSQGITPRRYAFGAAAALAMLSGGDASAEDVLYPLWRHASPAPGEQKAVLDLIEEARSRLKQWQEAGYPALEGYF